jgi:NADPH:quinone reductase-like Zn-dependent oxidoreductase
MVTALVAPRTERTMAKQIVISKAGRPEVLVERPVEPRSVGPGEVRIRVAAAGVNFADIVGRLGNYPDAPRMPYSPGYEVAGTIEELGAGVKDLAVGARVGALTRFGGYAEEVVTRADGVYPLPDGVELEVAAAVPVTYLTADVCLFDAGGARAGSTVLVHGGAGGVGSAALQLARGKGITLIATAGSPAKCEWMKREGVEHAIDYTREDVAARVKQATGGRGVDVVLDPIGGRNLQLSVSLCAPLGRVVSFGVSALNPGKTRSLRALLREGSVMRFFNLLPLFAGNVGIHGINMLPLAEADPARMQRKMADILARIAEGSVAPVIAERFPLSAAGAQKAHHYLQDRRNIGKVVLVRE